MAAVRYASILVVIMMISFSLTYTPHSVYNLVVSGLLGQCMHVPHSYKRKNCSILTPIFCYHPGFPVPWKVCLTCCHYQTCLCHAHSLNVSLATEASLDYLSTTTLLSSFTVPHIHQETDLLAFSPTLVSDGSFLPVFWWFLCISLNQLCPLTIGHHCLQASGQHFISFGVIIIAETGKKKCD